VTTNRLLPRIEAEKNDPRSSRRRRGCAAGGAFTFRRRRPPSLHAEIRRDRARNAMSYAEENAPMTVRAPPEGLAVLKSVFAARNAEVQEDELRLGVPV
jgi:hypothetical protein